VRSGGAKVTLVGRADLGRPSKKHVWILDSDSSVHLVNDAGLLRDTVNCADTWRTANGGALNVSRKGTVGIRTVEDGSATS
jgi:hypothetical protein